ncbi:MAG: hypothetical protein ACRC7W_06960 [Fusobacteriaceae bacterium]
MQAVVSVWRGIELVSFDGCTAEDIPQNVKDFCARMMHQYNNYWGPNHPSVAYCEISNRGKKFKMIRREIWMGETPEKNQIMNTGSVMGGIDKDTGDIYKSQGANAYAKGIRGNVNSESNGMEALNGSGHIEYLPKGRKAK